MLYIKYLLTHFQPYKLGQDIPHFDIFFLLSGVMLSHLPWMLHCGEWHFQRDASHLDTQGTDLQVDCA